MNQRLRSNVIAMCVVHACSVSAVFAGGSVLQEIVNFELTSTGAPDTASTSDQLAADIGMLAQFQFLDILITGVSSSGEQTVSAVTDLGFPPFGLPSGSVLIGYDTQDPGSFPLPPIVEEAVPLGSPGALHFSIEYQPDLSTAPGITGVGSITIEATSLGSFEFKDEIYATTAIGATGVVFFVTEIPTPGSAAVSVCLLVGFATRRRR